MGEEYALFRGDRHCCTGSQRDNGPGRKQANTEAADKPAWHCSVYATEGTGACDGDTSISDAKRLFAGAEF